MLRIIKKYKIPFKKVPKGETVPGVEMSFRCYPEIFQSLDKIHCICNSSGYPGVIYSGDDFTVSSSGLTILETTIGQTWQMIKDWRTSIFRKQQQRSLAVCEARGLCAGGGEGHCGQQTGSGWRHLDWDVQQVGEEYVGSWWVLRMWVRYNSGTYNNQWMVVNMNLFKPLASKLWKHLPITLILFLGARTKPRSVLVVGADSWILQERGSHSSSSVEDILAKLQLSVFYRHEIYWYWKNLYCKIVQMCSTRVAMLSWWRSLEIGFHTTRWQVILTSQIRYHLNLDPKGFDLWKGCSKS